MNATIPTKNPANTPKPAKTRGPLSMISSSKGIADCFVQIQYKYYSISVLVQTMDAVRTQGFVLVRFIEKVNYEVLIMNTGYCDLIYKLLLVR